MFCIRAVGKHGRKEARIVVNTEMKPIVYRIFELRAVEKKSYEAIGNIIRSEFKLAGSKTYKFNKSSVEKILLHPFYGGTFEWAGEEYEGKHELFIPPSWVQVVQGKMRGQSNKPMPLGSFSHFLKCAVPECGCQIIYDPKVKINRRAGTRREYHYYHCTDSKGVHKQLGLPQVNIAETKIWSQLENAVHQVSLTKDVAEDLAEKVHERDFEEAEKLRQQYAENKERLESLLKKHDQLYDDFSKGLVEEDDYRRLKTKAKDEIQLLKAKLENDYRSTQELVRVRLKFTLELAKDMESNWKEATPSDRVVLLKSVSSNFSLDGLNVRYDLKKPFAVLSEIKLKGVSKKWCLGGDSNSHTLADTGF